MSICMGKLSEYKGLIGFKANDNHIIFNLLLIKLILKININIYAHICLMQNVKLQKVQIVRFMLFYFRASFCKTWNGIGMEWKLNIPYPSL